MSNSMFHYFNRDKINEPPIHIKTAESIYNICHIS